MDKISSLGMPMHPKKYPRGTSIKAWGCPRGTPSSSVKIRSPFKTLYFYCFMYYAFFLERLSFCFQFCFVLYATINGWTPTNFFWRRCTHFSFAKNTPFFTLIVQRVFSFSRTVFTFIFCLDFCSDLVLSLHQGVFGPLGYVGIHQKSCFKKVRMVLEKRKSFMQKSDTKRSLFRLRLRLLHAMLDVILIVYLVIFFVA
jgi:hypothetical protein